MKAFWDLIKEVGWIGVVGIFFLVAGMALGFGLSLKDFLDLGSAAWTSEKKVAVILGAAGILVVVAAFVVGQARNTARQMVLEFVRRSMVMLFAPFGSTRRSHIMMSRYLWVSAPVSTQS